MKHPLARATLLALLGAAALRAQTPADANRAVAVGAPSGFVVPNVASW